ncbi:MAG: DNA polymerase III subunit alpha, partial [Lachnospiraceae bacterium]|nr:DNA polymerase III subunit alpha [Lachnospiraceae bacterium]
ILDDLQRERKTQISGQMTFDDFFGEDTPSGSESGLPPLPEYDREQLLAMEKEVLGLYVSGHPLEEYRKLWEKHITAKTSDFVIQEESGVPKLEHNKGVTVGGLITSIQTKYTKNNQAMAFLTLEDLVGMVEVIVFPKTYERDNIRIRQDAKVFVKGRVSVEDEQDGRLIAESIYGFEDVSKELWIKFADMETYESQKEALDRQLLESEGRDKVILYIEKTRQINRLPANRNVDASQQLLAALRAQFGEENVKLR